METQPGRTVPETHRWTSHTHATPHTDRRHTHTHKETSTHSHSQGQRLSESQVRTHRQSGKHTNPEKQMYIYTQIWTPDSQINTQTHPQTQTGQPDTHTLQCTGTNRQTSQGRRHTDPQPESDRNTHTDMWRETGGTPTRARRKDREAGGDEKMEMGPGA